MNASFWKNKRVLVTGHTGFKGGWLSIWLHKLGAQVHGYALAPITTPSLFKLARIEEQINSTLGDIRQQEELASAVSAAQPDIVFHLAAQPLVGQSYLDPVGTFDINVMGTAKLLECVRQTTSVKAVVVVSSDKCYENTENQQRFNELQPLGGHDPYSASKACTELVAQSWQRSFFQQAGETSRSGCAIATARAGNVIGGGDWAADRLVPDIMRCLNSQQTIVLRNPDAVRPWQHVLEPLAGYLLLAEKLYSQGQDWAQAWNFGPDDSHTQTVSWIVEKLTSLSKRPVDWVQEDALRFYESQMLKLDSSKARESLGWNNVWSIDTCLQEIIRWNEQWQQGEDVDKVVRCCIDRYVASYPTGAAV